jgi:hypothetical protein
MNWYSVMCVSLKYYSGSLTEVVLYGHSRLMHR